MFVERGVDESIIQYAMPHLFYRPKYGDDEIDEDTVQYKRMIEWFSDSCESINFEFLNYMTNKKPLDIYWIDENGKPVFKLNLELKGLIILKFSLGCYLLYTHISYATKYKWSYCKTLLRIIGYERSNWERILLSDSTKIIGDKRIY